MDLDCDSGRFCEYAVVNSTEVVRACSDVSLFKGKSCCKDADCGGGKCKLVQETFLGYIDKMVLRCQ